MFPILQPAQVRCDDGTNRPAVSRAAGVATDVAENRANVRKNKNRAKPLISLDKMECGGGGWIRTIEVVRPSSCSAGARLPANSLTALAQKNYGLRLGGA
jgi:hypothetical protein